MAVVHPVVAGSLVALVTPMNVDGRIDFEQLELLVQWHIQQKTDGLVVMGTTGESSLVSDQELLEVVARVMDVTQNRIPIVAGCGAASTDKTVKLARQLKQLKPAALLCVTPYYVKPEQEGVKEHFKAIADSSELAVILYNVPSRTGCDLSNRSVVELSSHENIVGLKDATAQLDRVVHLRKSLANEFLLLSGDDETAFDYVKCGGNGVISVTANISPYEMHEWIRLLSCGDVTAAKKVFEQLSPLHRMLYVESNPIPVKWALHLMGKIGTGVRKPLSQPSDQSKKLIKRVLHESGLA